MAKEEKYLNCKILNMMKLYLIYLKVKVFSLSLQEITLHAPLSPGVRGSVAGHQQEVSHLQSGH